MVEINITRIEEALKGQLSKDIKKWHDITHINNIMQGGGFLNHQSNPAEIKNMRKYPNIEYYEKKH